MTKRHIRLKEWAPNTSFTRAPNQLQLERSDGSLEPGPFSFKTDCDGFISSGRDRLAHPPVIVIGDSVTECLFARTGERMTDYAEQYSNTSVLNGGSSGMTALHALHVLTAKVIPMRPAMVILMNGVLDANAAQDPSGYWTADKGLTPVQTAGSEGPTLDFSGAMDLSQRVPILEAMALLCDRFAIQFSLATIPIRGNDDHAKRMGPVYHRAANGVPPMNELTRQAAQKTASALIDLDKIFKDRCDLFYDAYHLNRKGTAEIGEWLGNGISRQIGSR